MEDAGAQLVFTRCRGCAPPLDGLAQSADPDRQEAVQRWDPDRLRGVPSYDARVEKGPEGDEVPTLAQINATARKKALRRILSMAPAVVLLVAIWLLLGRVLGYGYSLAAGVLAGVVVFAVLEKKLGAAEE